MEPDDKVIAEITKAHLEAGEPECRWCFAIDTQRVKGKILSRQDFPDASLLHLSCPRCGSEFTEYIEGWDKEYLTNIVFKLHPELRGNLSEKTLGKINQRVFPEYLNT
ncbi:MAG: hypothetical protein HY665_05860 [Chloroflexi bacterium]|nr:hypothetical protein [Chloroflexota bacterium]